MSRPDYWQIRKTEPRVRHMAAIGAALGIDPDERAGAMRIVEFALAQTYLGLAQQTGQEESMEIRVEFSQDSLFGDVDPATEGIDANASAAQFAQALQDELQSNYPTADITVEESINDRVSVDGMFDHTEVPWIEEAIGQLWQDDSWYVTG